MTSGATKNVVRWSLASAEGKSMRPSCAPLRKMPSVPIKGSFASCRFLAGLAFVYKDLIRLQLLGQSDSLPLARIQIVELGGGMGTQSLHL
jgi:hypothetical protein